MIYECVIDRIEGDEEKYAVLEMPDCEFINYPLKWLPLGIKEGQILKFNIIHKREEGKND